MLDINTILGNKGPLALSVPGYAPREQQITLAIAIEHALSKKEKLIAEAGTGTGKTFAYLIPAMMSGKKLIISTGTKNLQDQLFYKDVPIVKDALAIPVSIALLKGRANYLCHHYLDIAEREGRYASADESKKISIIRKWSSGNHSGDISECKTIDEKDLIWQKVTSTSDNCVGQECQFFSDCYLMQARRQAQAADIVIINHYLLFSDMALKEEGFGELLPDCDAYIIDEAHQLPDIASNFFGLSVSSNQLYNLAQDVQLEYLNEINEDYDISDCTKELKTCISDLRLTLGSQLSRLAWNDVMKQAASLSAMDKLLEQLQELHALLEPLEERSKIMESFSRRCVSFINRLDMILQSNNQQYIRWCDIRKRHFSLHMTPMSIAPHFKDQLDNYPGAWIFTSATLTVSNTFQYFTDRMGIETAKELLLDSPFDYLKQALIYLPPDLPEPSSHQYNPKIIAVAKDIINIVKGRTFFLFTSYRALSEAKQAMENCLDYPLLVQGDAPRDALLDEFRNKGNAILLGTSSFWEGVDVRGEALSCVIIDKLPFASIGDPVLKARIDTMRENGENPFMNYQLPNAVITLKQGVGRLIRDMTDRGLLVLCDPRITTKPYGKKFILSLPGMPVSRNINDVHAFFQTTQNDEPAKNETSPVDNINS
ncbi:MAG: ATP-dependent DNA helicase [Gammaproteobacteria bacterium]